MMTKTRRGTGLTTRLLTAALVVLIGASCIEELRAAPVGVAVQNSKARKRVRRKARAVTAARPAADKTREVPVVVDSGKMDTDTAAPPAQDDDDPQTSSTVVRGGILNGKAISKPAPAYPPIARAARAMGTVAVEILVDEEGRVISAKAVSGHPLLQASAASAARKARFSPTRLSGEPVKVSGVITYNFVLQ